MSKCDPCQRQNSSIDCVQIPNDCGPVSTRGVHERKWVRPALVLLSGVGQPHKGRGLLPPRSSNRPLRADCKRPRCDGLCPRFSRTVPGCPCFPGNVRTSREVVGTPDRNYWKQSGQSPQPAAVRINARCRWYQFEGGLGARVRAQLRIAEENGRLLLGIAGQDF